MNRIVLGICGAVVIGIAIFLVIYLTSNKAEKFEQSMIDMHDRRKSIISRHATVRDMRSSDTASS